jgi:hypothetical protein
MKKVFAVLIGSFISSVAMAACNWNAENCVFDELEHTNKIIAEMLQNPAYVAEKHNSVVEKAQYTDRKVKSCGGWKCYNDAISQYNVFVGGIHNFYGRRNGVFPQAAAAAPAQKPVNDKWADQCVIGKQKVKTIMVYRDAEGTQTVGELGGSAYTVSNVNGGKLVGVKTVPDYSKPNPDAGAGKFVGWVKKSELDMQELRNCN